jgi:hypothetical protein
MATTGLLGFLTGEPRHDAQHRPSWQRQVVLGFLTGETRHVIILEPIC